MEAIGDVDEANAALGLARAEGLGALDPLAARLQNELFDLGADLATPAGIEGALRILPAQVARVEADIDAATAAVPPLTSFILPGGNRAASALHLARTIVRRAERRAVEAAGRDSLSPTALAYLNRLSDLLFALARQVARRDGDEIMWVPGASRP